MNQSSPLNPAAESTFSRRRFLKRSSMAAAGAAALSDLPYVATSHTAPDAPIRVGVIGCGGRGTGAVLNVLGATTNVIYPSAGYHTEDVKAGATAQQQGVEVVALADLFPDRLERCLQQLRALNISVPNEKCFLGFDSYQKLLAIPEINYVILTTPPHFRPLHLKAAIEAGKNAFIEKPVAVDGPGVRMVIEAGELAKQKKLGIGAGTQRRHTRSYIEAVKRIHDGAIGELVFGACFYNNPEIWYIERAVGWSDMEWQMRNWPYFAWLSGDHIVEQHVHSIDVMNWVLGSHPVKACAVGGRQVRTDKRFGHIFDHFGVEFQYENGMRMYSQCRQMNHCDFRMEEYVGGTKGTSNCKNWIKPKDGAQWRFRDTETNGYQQEHEDLIASIRAGQPLNEARAVAESTLMAIMGRDSAYSGHWVQWDDALNSKQRLGPEKYELGPLPFPEVPMPGQYKLG